MTTEKLNEKMVLVTINFRKTTGEVNLTLEDFGENVPDLPPGTLGTKQLISKKHLSKFTSLKKKAVELLKFNGVELHSCNQVLIPDQNYPGVKAKLEELIQKYQSETTDFLNHWDEYCDEYIAEHPEFETVLRNARPPLSRVRDSFVSDYLATRIIPLPGEEEVLEQRLGNLSETLIKSVSGDCRKYFVSNFKSSSLTTSKQGGRILLSKILKRCEDLNFISPRISPLVQYLRNAVSQLPTQGLIKEGHFDLLKGVISFMANRDLLEQLCNGAISANQLFGSSSPSIAASVPTPQEPELDFGLSAQVLPKEEVTPATPPSVAEPAPKVISTKPTQQNLQALLFGDDDEEVGSENPPNESSESDTGDSGMLPEAPETIDINPEPVETTQTVNPVAVPLQSGPRVLTPSVPLPDFDNL